jgi:hypothetical protein
MSGDNLMTCNTLNEFWATFFMLGNAPSSGPEMIYRGVTDQSFELIPSIGRNTKEGTHNDISSLEDDLMSEFKRLTVPLLKQPPKSDFEWLFLAQHYGLPTRLLDWTSNPLVALFFASEGDDNKDGVIHYLPHMVSDQYHLLDYKTADYNTEAQKAPISVFALQPSQRKFIFVRPRYTDERYVNQKSVFSCPKDPFIPLEHTDKKELIVKGEWKGEIRKRLYTMGMSTSFVYPGLAGITSDIKKLKFNPVKEGQMQIVTLRCELKL